MCTQNIEKEQPWFPARPANIDSLSRYHYLGGKMYDGLPMLCERNFRTSMVPAIIKSWSLGSVKMDLTGYGKYSESFCIVEIDGKQESWPFSMLYVSKNE